MVIVDSNNINDSQLNDIITEIKNIIIRLQETSIIKKLKNS